MRQGSGSKLDVGTFVETLLSQFMTILYILVLFCATRAVDTRARANPRCVLCLVGSHVKPFCLVALFVSVQPPTSFGTDTKQKGSTPAICKVIWHRYTRKRYCTQQAERALMAPVCQCDIVRLSTAPRRPSWLSAIGLCLPGLNHPLAFR